MNLNWLKHKLELIGHSWLFWLPWHSKSRSLPTIGLLNLVAIFINATFSVLFFQFLNVLLTMITAGVWLNHFGNFMTLLIQHPDCITLFTHESISNTLLHVIWLIISALKSSISILKHFLVLLILFLIVSIELSLYFIKKTRFLISYWWLSHTQTLNLHLSKVLSHYVTVARP